MFTKEDIEELLNEMSLNESMTIHYEGFTGRGINGLESHHICISNNKDIVEHIKGIDELFNIHITNFELSDRYIKATYIKSRKGKYDNEYIMLRKPWTVIVPYDKINSLEIKSI